MTMKKLIEMTAFKDDAVWLADLFDKAGITESDIPNLPRHMGMKARHISVYQLQSQLTEALVSGAPVTAHSDVTEEAEEAHVFEVLFGVRISLALQDAGLNNIDDLHGKDENDLSQINGIGRASAKKIVLAVSEQGDNDG